MTVAFKKTKSGKWAVVGPADEVEVGKVEVTTKAGKTKTVTVEKVGKTFTPSWADEPHRYGYLAEKAKKASTPKAAAPKGPAKGTEEFARLGLRRAVELSLAVGLSPAEVVAEVSGALFAADAPADPPAEDAEDADEGEDGYWQTQNLAGGTKKVWVSTAEPDEYEDEYEELDA
jgi:hypothetical protein